MKTLILNDEVEFDLSEQHGLIVRLRNRSTPAGDRIRLIYRESVAPHTSDLVLELSIEEVIRLKEFLNDPECHRSWW